MSEAIIFENMPYNLFLKQRLEFVVICQDHLAGNVMRIIEAEMIKSKEAWQTKVEKALDEKKPPPKEPKMWWVRLSLSQIIARLYMYDSAKLKKPESEDMDSPEWVEYRMKKALSISKGTLRKAIEQLKSLRFLLERSKPGDEFGAPIWTLHKESVQKALKALPQNPFTIFHALGGGSKFEYGGEVQNLNVPPTNFECGDFQNLNVPGSKFESGEVQILEVDIDSRIDIPSEIDRDIDKEGTDDSATAPSLPAPVPQLSFPARVLRARLKPVNDAANWITDPPTDSPGEGRTLENTDYHGKEPGETATQAPSIHIATATGEAHGHTSTNSGTPTHSERDYDYGTQQQEAEATDIERGYMQAEQGEESDEHDTRDYRGRDLAAATTRADGASMPTACAAAEEHRAGRGPEVPGKADSRTGEAEQHTLTAPQQGNTRARTERRTQRQVEKPQLTLLGGKAREWYETICACKLRMTANNVNALNVLGEIDGISFENLKDVLDTILSQDLVKNRNIPIGVQELASEDGYWRFDKWLPVVVRNRQIAAAKEQKQKEVVSREARTPSVIEELRALELRYSQPQALGGAAL